jgi:hypothetical protein
MDGCIGARLTGCRFRLVEKSSATSGELACPLSLLPIRGLHWVFCYLDMHLCVSYRGHVNPDTTRLSNDLALVDWESSGQTSIAPRR